MAVDERGRAVGALDHRFVLDRLPSWLQAQPESLLGDLLLEQVADVGALTAANHRLLTRVVRDAQPTDHRAALARQHAATAAPAAATA